MNCPGSVALIKTLELDNSDEPDYRRDGITAHAGAALCLGDGLDAWEIVGQEFDGFEFTEEMATAVQVYLDEVRRAWSEQALILIEQRMHEPSVHPMFYGTVDCAIINETHLDVFDYKHGEGIVVDANSPQFRYYAYGILQQPAASGVGSITLKVIQPRAFHSEGPIRTDILTREELEQWAEDTLKPAMLRAEIDDGLEVGGHCRFCPAKLICPAMKSLIGAMSTYDSGQLGRMDDATFGEVGKKIAAAKHFMKAWEEEAFRRLNNGRTVPHFKLVNKRATRVWRDGAEAALLEKYKVSEVYNTTLKSPAEFEKNIGGKSVVKEWAFTPNTGLTVAPADDQRMEVRVPKVDAQLLKFSKQ